MLLPVIRITIYQSLEGGTEVAPPDATPLVFQFYKVQSATIDSSWDNITQKAQVVLPRRIKRLGMLEYSADDYKNSRDSIFTSRIEDKIFDVTPVDRTSGTNLRDPKLTMKEFIQFTDGSVNSIINYNSNYNKGKIFRRFSKDSGGKVIYRVNPLIQKGDVIVIQLGYIITDRKGKKFNTINGGNINFGNATMKYPLPSGYERVKGSFDYNNRWRPYNRGFQFKGYIAKTSIDNNGNIILDCEDYMYVFNRARIPNKLYSPSDKNALNYQNSNGVSIKKASGWTLNNIVYDMVKGIPGSTSSGIQNIDKLPMACIQPIRPNNTPSSSKFGVDISTNIDMKLGAINVENATIGNVFEKLKEEYYFPIFFRPNTDQLVLNPFVYNEFTDGVVPPISPVKGVGYTDRTGSKGQEEFTFMMGQWTQASEDKNVENGFLWSPPYKGFYRNKQNIISNNLEFKNTDQLVVGANVKSASRSTTSQATTKDNRSRKKPTEIVEHVGDYGGYDYTFFYLTTTDDVSNSERKLRSEMKEYGEQLLSRINYTGLYGSFKTYGYPYVQFSDIVCIVDFSFPERSGRYYVKRVVYKASVDGALEQEIFIDYRLPNKSKN